MTLTNRVVAMAFVWFVLGWSGTAQAQYLLRPVAGNANGNGGQLQIGTGLPLPVGTMGFFGGRTPVNGGTMGPIIVPDGPGPTYWPLLLVRRNPASMGSIMQGLSTPQGGSLVIPPNVLTDMVGAVPRAGIGLFPTNLAVLMVRTTIDYAWPKATATFAPGGGPGLSTTPVVLTGPDSGTVTYNAGTKSFGGAAQFAVAPGPFAGTIKVPPNGLGVLPVASIWINIQKKLPASVTRALLVGASNPLGAAAPGAPGTSIGTTMFGPVPLAVRQFTAMLGVSGTIPLANSFGIGANPAVNQVTGTQGFPWTTGFITLSAPAASPQEFFWASGRDGRVAGVGNVSMVSGALSVRMLTGSNANRGWVTLTIPEPSAALGAACALAVLALCHTRKRRRRS